MKNKVEKIIPQGKTKSRGGKQRRNEIKLEVPPIRSHSWTTEDSIQERGGGKNGKEEIIKDLIQKNLSQP